MTDINTQILEQRRAGVRRIKKNSLKIDMTPMVDLGFLLISFFVITTELAKPKAMDLNMPKEGHPSDLCNSCALTILVDNNRIFYYEGEWMEALKSNSIKKLSSPAELRSIIAEKKLRLDNIPANKEGRNGLMMLIKPANTANYEVIVDVLDEATISMVKKYALLKLSAMENEWIEKN